MLSHEPLFVLPEGRTVMAVSQEWLTHLGYLSSYKGRTTNNLLNFAGLRSSLRDDVRDQP